MSGMPTPYSVHFSGATAEEIRLLQKRAKQLGLGKQVIAALRAIYARLQEDPANFGEPLYDLSAMQLQVRLAVTPPLVVDFAVHWQQHLVFVRRIVMMSG